MSAPISLLCITLMVFCVLKFISSLVGSCVSSHSSVSQVWRAGTKLSIRKSRCGLLGLAAQQLECGWQSPPLPALLLFTVCTLEWQAFLCEESQREDVFIRTSSAQAGIQGQRNSGRLTSCHFLMFGSDTERGVHVPPYVDLSFKKSSLWSGTVCCREIHQTI